MYAWRASRNGSKVGSGCAGACVGGRCGPQAGEHDTSARRDATTRANLGFDIGAARGKARSFSRSLRYDGPILRLSLNNKVRRVRGVRLAKAFSVVKSARRLERLQDSYTMIDWINAHALFAGAPVIFYVLMAMVDTHITTACVTLYLHRSQTHGAIKFHPVIAHFMRLWLWLRTAMPTKEWVAVHRCHHAHVDTDEDPHSPIVYGIWRVVFFGTALYHKAAHNDAVVAQYGKGTPSDWIEHRLYAPLSLLGPVVTLITNVLIFGTAGLWMWLVEMAWIP